MTSEPVLANKMLSEAEMGIPKTLVCCVCGQRLGVTSLRIHYPVCIKKFDDREVLREQCKKKRRKAPMFSNQQLIAISSKKEWSYAQIEMFNDEAMLNYRQHAMFQCKNCKRRFVEQAYGKHVKNCELINGSINGSSKNGSNRVSIDNGLYHSDDLALPRVLVCHICGREFGLTSLKIHMKQCEKQFLLQQAQKPKHQRKALPTVDQHDRNGDQYDINQAQQWSRHKIQKYNQTVRKVYQQKSMCQCHVCGRTFFPQSLKKHLKDCESKLKDMKKIGRYKTQIQSIKNKHRELYGKQLQPTIKTQKIIIEPKSLMCYICGRHYGTHSLALHIGKCKHRFERQQSVKNIIQRKVLAQFPPIQLNEYKLQQAPSWSRQQINYYNQIVGKIYKTISLHACPFCDRTFWQQSLKKHIVYCANNNKGKNILKKSSTEKIIQTVSMKQIEHRKPRLLTCYVCGMDFGLTSLKIHLPKCQKRFVQQQARQQSSKMLPVFVLGLQSQYNLSDAELWEDDVIAKYNMQAYKVYKLYCLHQCPYCHRTFFEESLKKHVKYCEKESVKRKRKLKRNLSLGEEGTVMTEGAEVSVDSHGESTKTGQSRKIVDEGSVGSAIDEEEEQSVQVDDQEKEVRYKSDNSIQLPQKESDDQGNEFVGQQGQQQAVVNSRQLLAQNPEQLSVEDNH